MVNKYMYRLGIFVVSLSLFSANILMLPAYLMAQTPTDTPTPTQAPPDNTGKLNELKDKIRDLEGKVNDLVAKEKSLASEISVMDNQIKLAELKINATENEISELEKDITVAEGKITNLEGSLDKITKVLLNRIVATYQASSVEPIQVLIGSNNVSHLISRANYLKIAQENDKKLMYNTVQAKNDYENQKNIFEQKKQKIETLKKDLLAYQDQIEKDKKAKADLLQVTKNDEKKYQALLESARAERSAIEGVLSTFQLKDGTPISKGQVIAVVGNSGAPYCSTGAHLHFMVRKNGTIENPANYLKSGADYSYSYESGQYDYYGTVSPSGDWDWPLDGPIKITQGYGSHGFARSFYANGMHDGIDMVSNGSSLIKAPKDGTLFKGSTNCRGATMNFVAVDHGEGIISWYWHVK
jgi:peptidoglycan hydrolase CwlO-like protein